MNKCFNIIKWVTKPIRIFRKKTQTRSNQECTEIVLDVHGELYSAVQEIFDRNNIIKQLKDEVKNIQEEHKNIVNDLNEKISRVNQENETLKIELCEAKDNIFHRENIIQDIKIEFLDGCKKLEQAEKEITNSEEKISRLNYERILDKKRIEELSTIEKDYKDFIESLLITLDLDISTDQKKHEDDMHAEGDTKTDIIKKADKIISDSKVSLKQVDIKRRYSDRSLQKFTLYTASKPLPLFYDLYTVTPLRKTASWPYLPATGIDQIFPAKLQTEEKCNNVASQKESLESTNSISPIIMG
ncbi:uncharacterized protein LOC142325406 [Lycorma delicatula]|uniref:uncharacterized protein LOC142325406 n=1 Tax=Lycorma delicatula TaxID=130591 RepID=UPI003F510863